MLFFDGGLGVLLFGVWVFCIIDVITTPEGATRNLPKLVWLLIVILLVDVGSIAWLIAGRQWQGANNGLPYKGNSGRRPAPSPTAAASPAGRTRASNPDDDEEFLAGLRSRAEEQRRRAREADRDEPPSAGQ